MKMLLSCFGIHAPAQAMNLSPAVEEEDAVVTRRERKKRKVVLVGDGECGKTCLLQRFCRDTYNVYGYLPTVYDTDVIEIEVDNTRVELMLTDSAGQDDYDRLRPYSYLDADAVIICFSVDNPDSLVNVRLNWIPEVRTYCGKNVPILLVGNKMDLRFQGEEGESDQNSISSEDFLDFSGCSPSASLIKQGPVKMSDAKQVAMEVGAVGYWETSALLDQGVHQVFRAAARTALLSRSLRTRRPLSCQRKSSFLEKIGIRRRP